MTETEEHDCCLIGAMEILHDKEQRSGPPRNGLGVIRQLRDLYEPQVARCSCCEIFVDVCSSVLSDRERRITLQMVEGKA
jgi:hypothetical protein